jgi:quercetin dioxygenase-like cupin family protein
MKFAVLLAGMLAFAAAAEKASFQIRSSDVPWTPVKVPGMPDGLQQRVLHNNERTKLSSAIVKYPKGFREPRHYHKTCGHSIYILKGKLKSPDGDLSAGMFTYAAPEDRHGPYIAEQETEILFYTDGPFDFVVDDVKK